MVSLKKSLDFWPLEEIRNGKLLPIKTHTQGSEDSAYTWPEYVVMFSRGTGFLFNYFQNILTNNYV